MRTNIVLLGILLIVIGGFTFLFGDSFNLDKNGPNIIIQDYKVSEAASATQGRFLLVDIQLANLGDTDGTVRIGFYSQKNDLRLAQTYSVPGKKSIWINQIRVDIGEGEKITPRIIN